MTQPNVYQEAIRNLEMADDNAEGDRPRFPYIWVRLAIAAVYALLAIACSIDDASHDLGENLPMAGRGN